MNWKLVENYVSSRNFLYDINIKKVIYDIIDDTEAGEGIEIVAFVEDVYSSCDKNETWFNHSEQNGRFSFKSIYYGTAIRISGYVKIIGTKREKYAIFYEYDRLYENYVFPSLKDVYTRLCKIMCDRNYLTYLSIDTLKEIHYTENNQKPYIIG